MGRRSRENCTRRSSFNVASIPNPLYCKQHAVDGMINVRTTNCSQDGCTIQPSFNVLGSKRAGYCKQHAADGMVAILRSTRCSHVMCKKVPNFYVLGSKTGVYFKQQMQTILWCTYAVSDIHTTGAPNSRFSMSSAARRQCIVNNMQMIAW